LLLNILAGTYYASQIGTIIWNNELQFSLAVSLCKDNLATLGVLKKGIIKTDISIELEAHDLRVLDLHGIHWIAIGDTLGKAATGLSLNAKCLTSDRLYRSAG